VADPGRREYALVASASYSGSTLLAMLLNGHPDIAAVGETSTARRETRMSTFQCSCGLLMEQCPFWVDVAERMHRVGHPDFRLANFELGFDPPRRTFGGRLLYGSLRLAPIEQARDWIAARLPAHRARMTGIGRRNRDFAHAILDSTGARVVVDTSKERMRARDLRHWLGMDLRVIHLVRDPRGVVYSSVRRGRDGGDERAAAVRWAKVNDAILNASAALPPERRLVVRYEALCADPEAVLRRIVRFLGLDPGGLWPSTESAPRPHVLGNRTRLIPVTEIRLDETWRTELSDEQLRRTSRASLATERRIADAERLADADRS
jgi:Sulfotransferase family